MLGLHGSSGFAQMCLGQSSLKMHAVIKVRGAFRIGRISKTHIILSAIINYIQQQIYTVTFWSKTKIQKRKSIHQVLSLFNISIWSSSYPERYLSFESHHKVTRVQQHSWLFLTVPPFYVCKQLKHSHFCYPCWSQKRNYSQYSWKKCNTFQFYMKIKY